MKEYMLLALKEAKKSYKIGDVPVGAVIVCNNKVISLGHNLKEKKNNAVMHAEIVAINKACKKLKRWRLEDCELYVTMEPCLMCCGAILQSRIKRIYYSIDNTAFGEMKNISREIKSLGNNIEVNVGLCAEESLELIKSFFAERRKK